MGTIQRGLMQTGMEEGLILVHVTAQPEPFLAIGNTQRIPPKVLRLSRKVDEYNAPGRRRARRGSTCESESTRLSPLEGGRRRRG
jgi:hypothetical protein